MARIINGGFRPHKGDNINTSKGPRIAGVGYHWQRPDAAKWKGFTQMSVREALVRGLITVLSVGVFLYWMSILIGS